MIYLFGQLSSWLVSYYAAQGTQIYTDSLKEFS